MRVAGEAVKGRLDARRLGSLCVRLVAVAEDVVLGDENVGRRYASPFAARPKTDADRGDKSKVLQRW